MGATRQRTLRRATRQRTSGLPGAARPRAREETASSVQCNVTWPTKSSGASSQHEPRGHSVGRHHPASFNTTQSRRR
eukprot:15276904-Alexandrium_andersonii.AAC.1